MLPPIDKFFLNFSICSISTLTWSGIKLPSFRAVLLMG